LTSETFRIAVICTGNRFRSPLAEYLLRRATAGLPVEVESYGLLDTGAAPILPELEEHAAAAALDLSLHRSRGLAGVSLAPVDLVIGFERRHVAHAVVHAGARLDRTFSLPELVGLLEETAAPSGGDAPVGEASAAVARAAAARPVDPRRYPIPEIADPLGKSPAVAARVADEVRALTERLATELFPR